MLSDLGVQLDDRGNVAVGAGLPGERARRLRVRRHARGQSLVVWAIWEGREAARGVDAHLDGRDVSPVEPLSSRPRTPLRCRAGRARAKMPLVSRSRLRPDRRCASRSTALTALGATVRCGMVVDGQGRAQPRSPLHGTRD
jgi:hypothetical protein